jgi:hypothetical protein
MSTKFALPNNLPKCACFNKGYGETLARCAELSRSAKLTSELFGHLADEDRLCSDAMMFFLRTTLVAILTRIAKFESPALVCGTEEMERETLRLLAGLEPLTAELIQHSYKQSRKLGLNEENVQAMYDRDDNGGQVH